MGEILIGVLISGAFLLIGIIATIFGQEYYARSSHKRNLELIKKELVFNKKIIYFEKISTFIEEHLKNYASLVFLMSNIKQTTDSLNLPDLKIKERQIKVKIKKIIKEISEENLLSIMPTGASLYFDKGNAYQKLANYIINHTRIVSLVAALLKTNFNDVLKRNEISVQISQNILAGSELIEIIKKELYV